MSVQDFTEQSQVPCDMWLGAVNLSFITPSVVLHVVAWLLSLLLQRWQSLREQRHLCLLAVLLLGQGLGPLRVRHQDGMSCAQGWLKEAFAGYRRGTEGGGVPAGEWQARNTEGRQFGPSHRGLLRQSCLLESSCVPPNGPALALFFSSIPWHGGVRGC